MFIADYEIIDLSHLIHHQVPTWDGSCGFHLKITKDYIDSIEDPKIRVQKIDMVAGISTHMDAPSHFIMGGENVDEIPLSQLLMIPIAMIDVSKRADEKYLLSVEEIKEYESAFGTIPPNSLVIIYTGWSKFWDIPERYRNPDKNGLPHFPAVSEEAAQFFIDRQVFGLAIDTLSPDRPESHFPVHRILLGAGKYLIENIANAEKLPPQGSFAIILPIKIEKATEAPIRILGLIKKLSNFKINS